VRQHHSQVGVADGHLVEEPRAAYAKRGGVVEGRAGVEHDRQPMGLAVGVDRVAAGLTRIEARVDWPELQAAEPQILYGVDQLIHVFRLRWITSCKADEFVGGVGHEVCDKLVDPKTTT